ncbi:TNF receptor-associated factor 2-like isoform X2 [Dermacentor andersoni]|uniref:TNF receptor-associated factor 2-like isoform X2 n=1 Tax=Dermacentor andersoni TaxID=34620 RepID=UPI002415C258|nr:TNF receptor-associated factor 6-like isoform X2 [Dermacentor andersoni]
MAYENVYKLRDHPDFPNEIDVPFAKKLQPELICSACNCVTAAGLKDGKDHVYCLRCAEGLTDGCNEFTCCICKWNAPQSLMKKNADEWAILEKAPSACPNRTKTCRFNGKLRDVLDHYKTCNLNGKVECILCRKLQDLKNLGDHIKNYCPMRLTECIFCGVDVAGRAKVKHEMNCDKRPGTCEHCGKHFKTHEELERQHMAVCELMPVDCSFRELGCDHRHLSYKLHRLSEEANRREMESHEAHGRRNGHNDLLVRKICRLEKENEDRKNSSLKELFTVDGPCYVTLQQMERKMAQLQESANAERTLRAKLEERVLTLQNELQETEDAVERLDRELRLDAMAPGFEYVWKVQPYFALKAAALSSNEEISTRALYINTPGYYVEFTVGFTRPASLTSPQHLSFKCQICSGEYDDMLPWPFQNKMILVLVNQQDERARRCFELDAATAEHAARCFQKPASGQRNPKFCYSQVIPIPLLENEKKGFLYQNCIVLKIVVPPLY